jgi:hypothetical protein
MMLRKLLVLTARVVALSCALGAARAHASPLTDLTGDTTSAGGLQASTVAGGAAAAYFNPALLIAAPAALSIGFMILNERIGVELDGRPGTQYAIPEGLANAAHADGTRFDNYAISTNELQYGRAKDARHEAFLARPRQGAGSGHDTLTYEVNLAPNRVKDELPDDAQISGEPVASAAGLQTNNPGWPGFTSGGWILGGTRTLTVAL